MRGMEYHFCIASANLNSLASVGRVPSAVS
uniref:Uncharacterized protein n=1 Tax=Anguilla anguilla TaxID=7936 RepID=A0A0E9Q410_ANGAN